MTSEVSVVCPYGKCDGSGIIGFRDENDVEFFRFCQCRKLLDTLNKLKFAEIPEEFSGIKVSDFNTDVYSTAVDRKVAETVKKIAIGYVEHFEAVGSFGKGLYFYSGTKGSGKTKLAVGIGNALIKKYGVSVRFITTVNLLNEIKNTFNLRDLEDGNFSKLLEAVKRVDVLILDDIGLEKPTNWVNEIFYNILNDRMSALKITFFTSNCSVSELTLDDRLVDRIGKMAMPVKFPEESIRSLMAKGENEELLKMILGG